jgi:pyruvate dehydrogenase (quinone)
MIKLEMLVDGLPDYETGDGSVDYAAIARAGGIHSVRIEQSADVRAGLSEALAHPGPARIDLVTDPNVLSIPPRITAALVKGFALAAGMIVLDGGVGEMLEIARLNLRNIPRPTIAR